MPFYPKEHTLHYWIDNKRFENLFLRGNVWLMHSAMSFPRASSLWQSFELCKMKNK